MYSTRGDAMHLQIATHEDRTIADRAGQYAGDRTEDRERDLSEEEEKRAIWAWYQLLYGAAETPPWREWLSLPTSDSVLSRYGYPRNRAPCTSL